MSSNLPRFVPTLTEVVDPSAAARPPAADSSVEEELAEQITHRVMQRVDAMLAARLGETVRSLVAEHTHALLPALRAEISLVVHSTVAEALAEEFAAPPGAA